MVVHVQAVDTGLLSLLPHGLGARLMYFWRDNCGLPCCTNTSGSESSAQRAAQRWTAHVNEGAVAEMSEATCNICAETHPGGELAFVFLLGAIAHFNSTFVLVVCNVTTCVLL